MPPGIGTPDPSSTADNPSTRGRAPARQCGDPAAPASRLEVQRVWREDPGFDERAFEDLLDRHARALEITRA